MLAASYWPKDRVMINRLDSICQAVLKGKWPGVRRTYEGNAVTSFYTTKLLDNTTTLTEDPSASPQGSKVKKHVADREKEFSVKINDQEGSLKLTFQKQGLPLKRPLEGEEGPLAQQQYLARLQELQNASDTCLADYTKTQNSYPQVLPEQMRLNGVMDGQPVIKKRRGRRKNVEGMDLLFMNRNRPPMMAEQTPAGWSSSVASTSAPPGLSTPQGTSTLDTETRVPVISLKDGTRLAGEDAPKRKDLDQWLKEHPGFVADVGAFIPTANKLQFQDGRPKQKRHRCRNPNKIDINSLTGEERVQIINRRNARKIGGAFAPPLKDLSRFLLENPEYGVPPEWADVVKQSGYLPESMFDRILTGPIVPEEVSRRGRRPKNALAKAATVASASANAALGLNPLLTNGLLAGLDLPSLQALQHNLQSLQSLQLTTGLMGLPHDPTNMATMFPMMLSGMSGLPNLLGMSGILGKQEAAGVTLTSDEDGKKKSGRESATPKVSAETLSPDGKVERTEGQSSKAASSTAANSNQTSASASGHPLALNPLLLSSMLYPGMLLTPGLNLPVANQPQAANTQPTPPLQPAASEATAQLPGRSEDKDSDEGEEPDEKKDTSGPEGSVKAESSSSESDSSSSSSEDSDSSDED